MESSSSGSWGRKGTSVRATGVLPRIFQVLLLLLWLQPLPRAGAAVSSEVLLRKYLMCRVTLWVESGC